MSNSILLIQVPETDVNQLRELQDYKKDARTKRRGGS